MYVYIYIHTYIYHVMRRFSEEDDNSTAELQTLTPSGGTHLIYSQHGACGCSGELDAPELGDVEI